MSAHFFPMLSFPHALPPLLALHLFGYFLERRQQRFLVLQSFARKNERLLSFSNLERILGFCGRARTALVRFTPKATAIVASKHALPHSPALFFSSTTTMSVRMKHLSATSFILLPICRLRLTATKMASFKRKRWTLPLGL